MRQLGVGQSLHFFAQPDVDAIIKGKVHTTAVTVAQIIHWTMLETCADIEHYAPQWARQGVDFKQRRAQMDQLSEVPTEKEVENLREKWLQPEARSLMELYGCSASKSAQEESIVQDEEIRARLEELGVPLSLKENLDEEQEREVDHEVEVEQQIERPPPASPAVHTIHPDILDFARYGRLLSSSPAFCSPGVVLTTLAAYHLIKKTKVFDSRFLASKDYIATIQGSQDGHQKFLKDVHWILLSGGSRVSPSAMVIISQFEANELIPIMRGSSGPTRLHVYASRAVKSMRPFDNFDFHSIPRQPTSAGQDLALMLRPQLSTFAGQLYPKSFDDLKALANFLGLGTVDRADHANNNTQRNTERDGFVKLESRQPGMMLGSPFTSSPVSLVAELTAARRRGQDYSLTPTGKLLRGSRMTEQDVNYTA
jgi:hypothetical protein